jgi:pilus assembly protein Flp/PilA
LIKKTDSPREHETKEPAEAGNPTKRRTPVSDMLLKLYVKLQTLTASDEGQDLVEYSLLLTLISLSLISGINGIAKAVNTTFSNISSSLA